MESPTKFSREYIKLTRCVACSMTQQFAQQIKYIKQCHWHSLAQQACRNLKGVSMWRPVQQQREARKMSFLGFSQKSE